MIDKRPGLLICDFYRGLQDATGDIENLVGDTESAANLPSYRGGSQYAWSHPQPHLWFLNGRDVMLVIKLDAMNDSRSPSRSPSRVTVRATSDDTSQFCDFFIDRIFAPWCQKRGFLTPPIDSDLPTASPKDHSGELPDPGQDETHREKLIEKMARAKWANELKSQQGVNYRESLPMIGWRWGSNVESREHLLKNARDALKRAEHDKDIALLTAVNTRLAELKKLKN